jgi:hypothetical protein
VARTPSSCARCWSSSDDRSAAAHRTRVLTTSHCHAAFCMSPTSARHAQIERTRNARRRSRRLVRHARVLQLDRRGPVLAWRHGRD